MTGRRMTDPTTDLVDEIARQAVHYGSKAENGFALVPADFLERVAEIAPARTAGAEWRKYGIAQPYGGDYQCERAELPLGHLSDDTLANAVEHLPSKTNVAAAKERIRWLSQALHRATKGIAG